MKGTLLAKLMGFLYVLYKDLIYCKREGTKARNKCKAQIQSKDGSPSILVKLIQKLKSNTEIWSMSAPGLCSSEHLYFLIQPLFQISRLPRQVDKKDLVCRLIC